MSSKSKQLDFRGQKIYVGIDVHKKHFTVSIQGDHLFYKTFNQPPQPSILVDYLNRHYPGVTGLRDSKVSNCDPPNTSESVTDESLMGAIR
jgi:hypothetical protein